MKISKKAVHIICGVFEAVFLVISILAVYYVADELSMATQFGDFIFSTKLMFAVLILLPLSLLIATTVIHALAVISPHHEQLAMKNQKRKQKRLERLQAEIDKLKKDGE